MNYNHFNKTLFSGDLVDGTFRQKDIVVLRMSLYPFPVAPFQLDDPIGIFITARETVLTKNSVRRTSRNA